MYNPLRARWPVLSLNAEAQGAAEAQPRARSQFEVLVQHLLSRFIHNELLGTEAGEESKRLLQIAYSVALPGLLFGMFLFPAYHAFPPFPYPRPFWSQAGDHYFYVMYALVLMGIATVYEWDLLFPDLLDVFVLSILPITNRRLFGARVLALAIFLALVLLGTSILGILSFPLIAGLPSGFRHLTAHIIAVVAGGSFAATTFLALQGLLLNTIGEGLFRKITPLLQGASLMTMLTVLLLYPTLSGSLQLLLTSGSPVVRYFPPFWFLGIYESLLHGGSIPPIFGQLAHTGVYALLLTLALTVLTYPLAYRRRVRQLIEGTTAAVRPVRAVDGVHRLLNTVLVRRPAERAMFYFIGQTILRSPRHRVMLAMYGGLGIALTLANMVVLHLDGRRVVPTLLPYGIRAAVPIVAFWTVTGLRSTLAATVDRRGAWIFRVIPGGVRLDHLTGTRLWVTTFAAAFSLATALVLHILSPIALRTSPILAGQLLMAIGLSVLLGDLLLFKERSIPFIHVRTGSIADFPLMILRYFVLFPIFVGLVVHFEAAIESSLRHLIGTALLALGVHLLLLYRKGRSLERSSDELLLEDTEEFPQSLGLRS